MEWYRSESTEMPLEIDMTSSSVYNYVRRNIEPHKVTDDNGETHTVYQYEEMKVPKESWAVYEKTEKNSSDIDYIAIMSDITLEG